MLERQVLIYMYASALPCAAKSNTTFMNHYTSNRIVILIPGLTTKSYRLPDPTVKSFRAPDLAIKSYRIPDLTMTSYRTPDLTVKSYMNLIEALILGTLRIKDFPIILIPLSTTDFLASQEFHKRSQPNQIQFCGNTSHTPI